MTVPMGQICLWQDCDKSAQFIKDGSYYCAEHLDQSTVTFEDNDFVVSALVNAISQINYLSKRLSAKAFIFTRPTTKEAIKKLNEAINQLTE